MKLYMDVLVAGGRGPVIAAVMFLCESLRKQLKNVDIQNFGIISIELNKIK